MKIKKKMIAFDADTVLLDWLSGFLYFLEEKGHCVEHVKQYLGTTKFIPTEKITKSKCKEYNKQILKEFAESGVLSQLDYFKEENHTVLTELNKHYEIAVVTCIGRTEQLISQRKQNLINLYGDIFSDILCINFGESKEESLRKLSEEYDIVAYIDDREKHLAEAKNVGIKSILLSSGLDVNYSNDIDFSIVSSLSEIKEYQEIKKIAA